MSAPPNSPISPAAVPAAVPVATPESIEDRYAAAVATSKTLKQKPADEELLRMYGMFKYIKEGNATGSAPNFLWNAAGNYKWHEWKKYDNRDVNDVREQYIAYVGTLVAKYGVK